MRLSDIIDYDSQSLKVYSRESRHREFKQELDQNYISKYLKTMAAFANSHGGMLIFGVSEKPRYLVGIASDAKLDEAVWTDHIKRFFEPLIDFEVYDVIEKDKEFQVIEVKESDQKPVLCKKGTAIKEQTKKGPRDVQILHEGTIYYRYAGQSTHIRFGELRKILQERDERTFERLFQNIQVMRDVGVDRIGVVDTQALATPSQQSKIYVSKEAAKNLNVVDRANLTEDADAKAYEIAGTVELNQAVEVPVPDHDKIRPTEAANQLQPKFRDVFWNDIKITPNHLSAIARAFNIRRSETDYDERLVLYDAQVGRWFYRNAFIEFVERRLQETPAELLKALASKTQRERYELLYGPLTS